MPLMGARGGGSVRGFGRFGFLASVTALGGSITDSGIYRYHYFYSNDTLAVSSANVGKTMDILVVGGGTKGDDSEQFQGQAGGGGRGSQWGIASGLSLTAGNYPVVVAASQGTSSFNSSYTADRNGTSNLSPNFLGGDGGQVNYNFAVTSTQNGQNGSTSNFEGTTTNYAGGGGSGQSFSSGNPSAPAGSAGLGSFGRGGQGAPGNGGFGGNQGSPGNSGIVIVRYLYP